MIYYRAGKYLSGEVSLPITSLGFRFGFGVFETLAYNGERVCHVERHGERFGQALKELGLELELPDMDPVLDQVLERNGLKGSWARINYYGVVVDEGTSASLIVSARPYIADFSKEYRLFPIRPGWQSRLAAYKSMNHLYFHLARQEALEQGFDDGLILSSGDEVLETAGGSVVFQQGGRYYCPSSRFKLPGTALAIAGSVLDITPRSIALRSLPEYGHVYMLNSLIGMRPVRVVGDVCFEPDLEVCNLVTERIVLAKAKS